MYAFKWVDRTSYVQRGAENIFREHASPENVLIIYSKFCILQPFDSVFSINKQHKMCVLWRWNSDLQLDFKLIFIQDHTLNLHYLCFVFFLHTGHASYCTFTHDIPSALYVVTEQVTLRNLPARYQRTSCLHNQWQFCFLHQPYSDKM